MFILYNNQLIPESELLLPITDRAFQFSDGFFETAILVNGQIRLWKYHQQRMHEAAEALQLELPPYFGQVQFEEVLLQLAQQQKATAYGRLKLKVWRAGAGLYTPQTKSINWLASISPVAPATSAPLHIGICQKTFTAYTPISHFKGPNAPLYVLASLEKLAQQQDDMLLLSQQDMVAELTSSNIFWVKDDTLYTPQLSAGCVNGILRRAILDWCRQKSIPVREVLQKPELLLQADAVFASNVTVIRAVVSINGQPLQQQERWLQQLRADLQV